MGGDEEQGLPGSQPERRAGARQGCPSPELQNCDICSPLGTHRRIRTGPPAPPRTCYRSAPGRSFPTPSITHSQAGARPLLLALALSVTHSHIVTS